MDWFDSVSAAWVKNNPDEDYSVLPPLVRLSRIGQLMENFQKEVTLPFDLPPTDYSVLAALRRTGAPYRLTPSELYNVLERSSGGMSKMLKRLEDLKLIARVADSSDGRSTFVQLTKKGQKLESEVFNKYIESSRKLMDGLSKSELKEIDDAMNKFTRCFERYFYR